MHLLLVVEEENLGGAELSFLELSRSLASRCDVHLAVGEAAFRNHSAYRLVVPATVTLHRCKSRLNPSTAANLHRILRRTPARELAALVERLHPAALIVNLPTVERGQAVIDAAKMVRARPPVWGLLHLIQKPSTIGARLGKLRDSVVQRLLRRFDRLLTVSQTSARGFAETYGLPRPDVLYPPTAPLEPVSSRTARDRRRAQENLPSGFLLGMVGRVELRQKGHDAALRVVARLLRAGHELHFVVVGDGPDATAVRRFADELGIASHVLFLGWRQDVAALIPLLDAVLLPSRFEGLPQTALQAATAHVPVVGYGVDGLTEFLPPDFQVHYGNEHGLVTAVEALLQGVSHWPSAELAERATAWGSPERAAERLLGLIRTGSVESTERLGIKKK